MYAHSSAVPHRRTRPWARRVSGHVALAGLLLVAATAGGHEATDLCALPRSFEAPRALIVRHDLLAQAPAWSARQADAAQRVNRDVLAQVDERLRSVASAQRPAEFQAALQAERATLIASGCLDRAGGVTANLSPTPLRLPGRLATLRYD